MMIYISSILKYLIGPIIFLIVLFVGVIIFIRMISKTDTNQKTKIALVIVSFLEDGQIKDVINNICELTGKRYEEVKRITNFYFQNNSENAEECINPVIFECTTKEEAKIKKHRR